MTESSIYDLLTKAEKSETVSFFEEILTFIKEIKPVLDKINTSIEENVKKMPNAAKKISKVTEATELATTEILDIIDGVFPKIDSVTEKLKEINNGKIEIHKKILDFLKSIEKGILDKIDLSSLLPEIQAAIKKQQEIVDNPDEEIIKQPLKDLQSLIDDSTSIMISLQVQDITSQQLAAVKHLLDTIQLRLSDILKRFHNSDIRHFLDYSTKDEESQNITKLHKEIAFDPNAVDAYDIDGNRQEMVDEMIKQNENGTLNHNESNENISNDEIDDMFNNNFDQSKDELSANNTDDNASDIVDSTTNNIPPLENTEKQIISEEDKKTDEEDNNALFSDLSENDDDEISQDDIDKLFAGN